MKRFWPGGMTRGTPAASVEDPLTGDVDDERLSPDDTQRGRAAVAAGASLQSRLQGAMGMVVLGGLGTGLLAWYYLSAFHRVEAARTADHQSTALKADADAPLPPLGRVETAAAVAPPSDPPRYRIGSVLEDPSALPANDGELGAVPRAPATGGAMLSPAPTPVDRRLTGAVFAHPQNLAAAAAQVPLPSTDERPPGSVPDSTDRALTRLLESTPPAMARASVLPTQRLLLPKGAFLDCTLQTALDSTLPGLTTCLTAVDTFSADGSVVLLERGTRLIGETRGDVAQGASRLFVLWTEARTPTGVVVPLASPGTDELGRSGLPGHVDRHFWDRFGAAILVSMIDGAVQAAAAHQAGANGALVLNPSGTRDVTTEILRSTINIAPTIRKAQGDRIQVLVARDLDFRSVYALQRH
jgi:type IV secretion system protein VirB10